jgi:hypothetical protein
VALVVALAMVSAKQWQQWVGQQSTKKWQQMWRKRRSWRLQHKMVVEVVAEERPMLVKTEAALVALVVMAVEMLVLVAAAATVDGDGNSCQNRVSGGSGGGSGYGGGRQQQKLWGQATINKMQHQ